MRIYIFEKKNGGNEKELLSFVECFMVQSNEYSERVEYKWIFYEFSKSFSSLPFLC